MAETFTALNRDDNRELEINSRPDGMQFIVRTVGDSLRTKRSTLSPEKAYELREWINSLPEENFAEPKPRWAEGDIVRVEGAMGVYVWVRQANGRWAALGMTGTPATDESLSQCLAKPPAAMTSIEVLRQASGQDLA
jgi:hypothetical protein